MTAHEPGINEIPIGVQDFKALRDDGFCFVDKSAFIDRILEEERPVFLFLRPRRFGKSLNLSMIDAYLSDKHPGNHWFDDLEISRIRPDDPDKNTNPVINLDMKGLGNGTARCDNARVEIRYRARCFRPGIHVRGHDGANRTGLDRMTASPGHSTRSETTHLPPRLDPSLFNMPSATSAFVME